MEALAGGDLSERDAMSKLPQTLVNVAVRDRGAFARREQRPGGDRGRRTGSGGPRACAGPRERHRAAREGHGRGADRRRRPRTSAAAWSTLVRTATSARRRAAPAARGTADIVDCVCGIVGYVGERPVRDVLLEGLTKLEYRGYDSAGISVIADDHIEAIRAVGNLSALRAKIDAGRRGGRGGLVAVAAPPARTGIGHTRWATHGRVSEENAHPHFDSADRVHVVVNGIVENYMALKDRLADEGCVFTSETDAEVIAHLIAELYDGDLPPAVLRRVRAARGPLRVRRDEPGRARPAGGRAQGVPADHRPRRGRAVPRLRGARLPRAHARVQHVENGEIVVLTPARACGS